MNLNWSIKTLAYLTIDPLNREIRLQSYCTNQGNLAQNV